MHIPSLKDGTPERVDAAIRDAYLMHAKLISRVDALEKHLTAQPPVLTPHEMRGHLEATGPTQINVQGLLGQLAQPQPGAAAVVSALPGPNDPLSQGGTIVALKPTLTLYIFNSLIEPANWVPVLATPPVATDTVDCAPCF